MEAKLDEARTEEHSRSDERIIDELKAMIHRAEEKAREGAKAADKVVRDHPYQAVGIAFGLGLLIGVLARRK